MAEEEAADIYTIGHSTRSLEEFIEALKAHGIEALVDIRTAPGSRHVPHFNQEVLAEALPAVRIRYMHMKSLGAGGRGRPFAAAVTACRGGRRSPRGPSAWCDH